MVLQPSSAAPGVTSWTPVLLPHTHTAAATTARLVFKKQQAAMEPGGQQQQATHHYIITRYTAGYTREGNACVVSTCDACVCVCVWCAAAGCTSGLRALRSPRQPAQLTLTHHTAW